MKIHHHRGRRRKQKRPRGAVVRRSVRVEARRSDPRLQHIFVGCLRIEEIHALELDPQAVLGPFERMPIPTAEVADIVTAQLHHMESRSHIEATLLVEPLDRDIRDDMIGCPLGLL